MAEAAAITAAAIDTNKGSNGRLEIKEERMVYSRPEFDFGGFTTFYREIDTTNFEADYKQNRYYVKINGQRSHFYMDATKFQPFMRFVVPANPQNLDLQTRQPPPYYLNIKFNGAATGTSDIYKPRQFNSDTLQFEPQTRNVDIWQKGNWVENQNTEAFWVWNIGPNDVYPYDKLGTFTFPIIQNDKQEAPKAAEQAPPAPQAATQQNSKGEGPTLVGALGAIGNLVSGVGNKQPKQEQTAAGTPGQEKAAETTGAETPADQPAAGTLAGKEQKAATQKPNAKTQETPTPDLSKKKAMDMVDALIDTNVRLSEIQSMMKSIFGDSIYQQIKALHDENQEFRVNVSQKQRLAQEMIANTKLILGNANKKNGSDLLSAIQFACNQTKAKAK